MNAHLIALFAVFFIVALPVLFVGLLPFIGNWMEAREKRKKAAAAAADSDGVESAAPKPA